MIERPRLRADQVQPGDRLLVADDLDLSTPLPAMSLIDGLAVTDGTVMLNIAGRRVFLPADAAVVVEREQ